MSPEAPPPSAARFAWWAAFLVFPLVLAAGLGPPALRWIRAARQPTVEAVDLGAVAPSGQRGGAVTYRASRPEAATPEEVEAAAATARAAAQLEERHLSGATAFAPRDPTPDPSGERVGPFQGFGVSIDSVPPGAQVLLDGRNVGESPIVASVTCVPGQQVEVRVERATFRPHRQLVRCRADALVALSVRLRR